VYMGAEDIQRQAPNVFRMKLLGATWCLLRAFQDAQGRVQ